MTVKAVYIRQTGKYKNKVIKVLNNLETLNVSVCYFKIVLQSHTLRKGLISKKTKARAIAVLFFRRVKVF
jgi:hypothetical protein